MWGGGGAALRNASSPRSGNGSGSERGVGSEGSVTSAGAGKKGKGPVSAGTPPAVPSGKCMCERRITQTHDKGEMYDAAHPARAEEREFVCVCMRNDTGGQGVARHITIRTVFLV